MTEKAKLQAGAALYGSKKSRSALRQESPGLAKGRDLFNAKSGTGIQLEARQGDDE